MCIRERKPSASSRPWCPGEVTGFVGAAVALTVVFIGSYRPTVAAEATGTPSNRIAVDGEPQPETPARTQVAPPWWFADGRMSFEWGSEQTLSTFRCDKGSDRRLVRPILRGALPGKEIGPSQAILPVVVGRFWSTPHIALSGAVLALSAPDCNGWPRRWVLGGRRDLDPVRTCRIPT